MNLQAVVPADMINPLLNRRGVQSCRAPASPKRCGSSCILPQLTPFVTVSEIDAHAQIPGKRHQRAQFDDGRFGKLSLHARLTVICDWGSLVNPRACLACPVSQVVHLQPCSPEPYFGWFIYCKRKISLSLPLFPGGMDSGCPGRCLQYRPPPGSPLHSLSTGRGTKVGSKSRNCGFREKL